MSIPIPDAVSGLFRDAPSTVEQVRELARKKYDTSVLLHARLNGAILNLDDQYGRHFQPMNRCHFDNLSRSLTSECGRWRLVWVNTGISEKGQVSLFRKQ